MHRATVVLFVAFAACESGTPSSSPPTTTPSAADFAALADRLAVLEATVGQLGRDLQGANARLEIAEQQCTALVTWSGQFDLRMMAAEQYEQALWTNLVGIATTVGDHAGALDSLGQREASAEASLAAVQATIAPLSIGYFGGKPSLVISGVNVFIRNGSGESTTVNGVGNLILGYSKLSKGIDAVPTGSHNLIVGDAHDVRSHSGIVLGYHNSAQGPYELLSGQDNVAMHAGSAVIGGSGNTASSGGAVIASVNSQATAGHSAVIASSAASAGYARSAVVGQNGTATSGTDRLAASLQLW